MTVYILRAAGTDLYKIGYTNGLVAKRVASMRTGCPHRLETICWFPTADLSLEQLAHKRFGLWRERGEWFKFTPLEAENAQAIILRVLVDEEASRVLRHAAREVKPEETSRDPNGYTVVVSVSIDASGFIRWPWVGEDSEDLPDTANNDLFRGERSQTVNEHFALRGAHHRGQMDALYG